jgi:Flp pilus assembly protein TadD
MKGQHLWAERYDGTMGKIFALQDRVTRKIVSALAVRLTGNEKQIIAEKGTNNIEAYDAFLRGRVHYLRMTPNDLTTAVQSFKKAIELDPNYGRAYAALALAYFMGFWQSGMYKGLEAAGISRVEARLRAGQYLKQAMKNPTSTAHHVNGLVYLFRRQHEEAVSELERALALDPNDPSCNSDMGSVLNFSGKSKEAVDFLNRAMRLDPHNPSFYLHRLGAAQFCMGNLEEAANLLEKSGRLNPETRARFPWLAATYGLLGREKEARLSLDNWGKAASIPNLPLIMPPFPFKDRAGADRFAQGLIKAGIKAPPWGYFPTFKENRLTGEEIKKLLFGAKTTGIVFEGQQWWVDCKKNGEFTWRGPSRRESNRGGWTYIGPSSDNGKSWVEGDLICRQFQKRYWGLEYCGIVYRNPGGTYEGKDEYFSYWDDMGVVPFSVER